MSTGVVEESAKSLSERGRLKVLTLWHREAGTWLIDCFRVHEEVYLHPSHFAQCPDGWSTQQFTNCTWRQTGTPQQLYPSANTKSPKKVLYISHWESLTTQTSIHLHTYTGGRGYNRNEPATIHMSTILGSESRKDRGTLIYKLQGTEIKRSTFRLTGNCFSCWEKEKAVNRKHESGVSI